MICPWWFHFWSSWSRELLECPGGELVVVELRQRYCRKCNATDATEEVLSFVSL
ncbi:hypothetical protein [Streptomyces agglomeratus]|uniref:hypothetical protein n=1 Tax=Streptomyces agglomeratus TaxID=285458 RepID=UPI001428932B|nr:hypothetical protein [Streptomyces agglomeratus]